MSIYLGTVKMSGSAGIAGGDASVIASNITLSTTAQPYITINNSSKTIALPATDPYTSARTPASHAHGQLTNAGAITSTAVALASGDSLVFVDSSDSSKIKKTSITFDGSTTTKYLSQAGTWVSVPTGGGGTLVVPFTIDQSTSPWTVSTTTSIDTIVNAIHDGKYVVGEAQLLGLMRFQLVVWWEGPEDSRTVMFILQMNLNSYTFTGSSSYSGGNWTDQWTVDEINADLNSLTNVNADSPTNGQVLAYNSTNDTWEPRTVSGGGGASYLGDLNDVSTTGASSGQALVYNGSSWSPGTVSGGGSWSPTQLSSGFRIWNLDPGIYQMPAVGEFYYYGSSGSPTLSSTGGMLYIYSDNSIKCWYIITDYAGGASNGAEVIISGWSSSSGGSYGMHYLSSSNNGSRYFGVHDYSTSTLTTLNSSDRPYTDNGVFCSQINSSTIAKPTNLTLSSATRMMMFVTRNYTSGSYSGYNARQDLYVPSLHKHYYRYISFTTSSVTPITTTPNCDTNGWVEEISIPSYTSSDAGKCLQVATGGASLQWATVSGGGGGASYDFNDTPLTYSSTYSDQGLSVYYADCTSAKRNVMFLNIDSSVYASYFNHDEVLGIYLKTTDLTENYVFIYNTSGHDITADYESWNFITSSDTIESVSHLSQIDSSGNYITIPNNYKTTMLGISRMQMNNEVFMVITYGGTFHILNK